MKILYIGCYRDGTGWAHAAQNYILALDSVGIEVVPRYIKLNNNDHPIPERISELENQSDKNCDIVIQHVLPHMLEYSGEFDKNIALYVTETDHCKNTAWPDRINLMDEAWVPNSFMAEHCVKKSNIFIPHQIIPHTFDMHKYQKQYEKIAIPELKDKFVFYYIGEINRRKNLGAMLKAFHTEFRAEEDVAIVIKGHIPGATATESTEHLKALSSKVKEGLKIYDSSELYQKEIFICDYLPEEHIMALHANCDCFVSASFGEAWGIPIFDAMAMGNTPICTNTGGPSDFISDGGWLVNSRKEPCFGVQDSFKELYAGNENWDSISINHMRKCMREAFENKELKEEKSKNGIKNSYEYSYEKIGQKMKECLLGKEEAPYCYNKDLLKNYKLSSSKFAIIKEDTI